MYETLLFLHILAAFMLMAGVVVISAMALHAPIGTGTLSLGIRLVEIGGTLVLVFGVWIVLREDFYDLTDGWILGAIGLWIVATTLGTLSGRNVTEGENPRFQGSATMMHWLSVVAAIGILILMVWKPGA